MSSMVLHGTPQAAQAALQNSQTAGAPLRPKGLTQRAAGAKPKTCGGGSAGLHIVYIYIYNCIYLHIYNYITIVEL
jgi:hypothetical protein